MIVVMNPRSTDEDVGGVVKLLQAMGTSNCVIDSAGRKVVEVLGVNDRFDRSVLERAPMVDKVLDKAEPIHAIDRKAHQGTYEVPLGTHATIGGKKIGVIAGPCSVETQDQLLEIAAAVKEAGAIGLRGGAFKPRTTPYSFQGHGERGLEMLARAREETGLAIVTEVMCRDQVALVAKYADVLQVGSRNMHCSLLLTEVGKQDKPVLLKRGWSATIEEYLMAAEYVMQAGNRNIILCERGIRTHERYVRNTLALAVVPELKRLSRLPVIVDPSHGTGRSHLVPPMSKAAIACGADGLLLEVHHTPAQAWSDGEQSLDLDQFSSLMKDLPSIIHACGRA
ncbi:MAG: 3-deoxy-7-phosphoheptulonate synthase [Phycisphaerae bacterium]|nr:3-deoxy-7-phosphoheptulonate synthase [Phycisphaerae bacterium]